jgi:hypothetical protein
MNGTCCPRRVTGGQRLALAVILQALDDARDPCVDPMTRLEATEFLGDQRSEAWYRLAALDSRTIRTVAGVYARRRAS